MKLYYLRKHSVIILGFGKEGQSVYRYIRKKFPRKKIAIADRKAFRDFAPDMRELLKGDKRVTLHLGEDYLTHLKKYQVIIKSPGINRRLKAIKQAVKKGCIMTTGTNIFFAQVKGMTIGITGSKGKSTTCTALYEILKTALHRVTLCGNIGLPMLDFLDNDSKDSYYVIELSSQQAEDLTYTPKIAVFTSFWPDHMDYHGDIRSYFQAKTKIFGKYTYCIYNSTFEKIDNFFRNNHFKFTISYMSHINTIANGYFYIKGIKVFPTKNIKLPGRHNLENLLATILVAQKLRIDNTIIQQSLESFTSLKHRIERVGRFEKKIFYNDSASVTPQSTMAAIKAIDTMNIQTLILGGLDRGYDFNELIKYICQTNITNIACFPDSGNKIIETLNKHKFIGNIFPCTDMKECVHWCIKHTDADKICLLSPGSPSYFSFKNFYDRGEQYLQAISEYFAGKEA